MTRGSGLAPVFAFVYSLMIAAHLPYGLFVWAAVWSGLVFRAASNPRNRGGELTTGERRSS